MSPSTLSRIEHEKMVDDRAEADHQRIEEMHAHMDEIRTVMEQHITQSLDNIQKILIDHLEKNQEEDHKHIEETHKAIMTAVSEHKEELSEINQILTNMTQH